MLATRELRQAERDEEVVEVPSEQLGAYRRLLSPSTDGAGPLALRLLTRSTELGDQLRRAGFGDPIAIAAVPRAAFVRDMREAIDRGLVDPAGAGQLHDLARRQMLVLQNMWLGDAARRAQGLGASPSVAAAGGGRPSPCSCDCGSAVSPLAYLTDLLDYAVTNIRRNGRRLLLTTLTAEFGQPFAELPTNCAASETLVPLLRLCVEVLLRRPNASAADTGRYLRDAVDTLLQELGTSGRELRLARSASSSRRESLASRLGIALIHLDELIAGGGQLRGDVVEQRFGLLDFAHDPLSTGTKLGDANGQYRRWQLSGAAWAGNTDAAGHVHLRLDTAIGRIRVRVYRDSARQPADLVAQGDAAAPDQSQRPIDIDVVERNGSGLTGRIRVAYQASDDQTAIVAVPELTAWRLEALRDRWTAEDWPQSLMTGDDLALPLVDPDRLSDDDFSQPHANNAAYKLSQRRRTWLDEQLARFDRDGVGTAWTVAEMFRQLLQPATYDVDAGDGTVTATSRTPWASLPDWVAMSGQLQGGDEQHVATAIGRLRDDFMLTPETFSFLDAARRLGNDELAADRARVLDVVVSVVKAAFNQPWLNEESALGLAPTPALFVVGAELDTVNPLRSDPAVRVRWQTELARNAAPPVVDPDLLDESWLLPTEGGDAAFELHHQRATQLASCETALQDVIDGPSLEACLTNAGPLHPLGFTSAQLDQARAAIDDGRELSVIPAAYGLTPTELVELLDVRGLAASGVADTADWSAAHSILIQAEKRRHLYPRWRDEERAGGITVAPLHFRYPSSVLQRYLPPRRLTARPDGKETIRWRFSGQALRAWTATFDARVDQQHAAQSAVRTAVERAEEAALPGLRDRLLDAVVSDSDLQAEPPGEPLVRRSRFVTNQLLINAGESGCRRTTRVAQAIETLQLLLRGIRTGQLDDQSFELVVGDNQFDSEWRWLGSYATWRAAMLVFLYPENLLDPTLRPLMDPERRPVLSTDPAAEQTPLFQAVVKVVSGSYGSAPSPSGDDAGGAAAAGDSAGGPLTVDELAGAVAEVLGDLVPWSSAALRAIHDHLPGLRFRAGDAVQAISGPYFYVVPDAEEEDALHIPLFFAGTFQQSGDFVAALDWYRTVYDYAGDGFDRTVVRLLDEFGGSAAVERDENRWLEDPLNPHRIARTRARAYQRFVLISIVRCLLEAAESDFAIDTGESLAQARQSYDTAVRLLDTADLRVDLEDCDQIAAALGDTLTIRVGDAEYGLGFDLARRLAENGTAASPADAMAAARRLADGSSPGALRAAVRASLFRTLPLPAPVPVGVRLGRLQAGRDGQLRRLLDQPDVASALFGVRGSAGFPARLPGVPFEFCIASNPLLAMLRQRAEIGLFKLSNCMNLAGLRREVPAYAAATDTSSGLPSPGGGAVLPLAAAAPTPYRYRVLVERARQLAGVAQQMEASYLSFLERRDQEEYTVLKARQDVKAADATVALQDLRVAEAVDQRKLAEKQLERSEFVAAHYQELIDAGLTGYEVLAVSLLAFAAVIQGAAVVAGLTAGGATGGAATGVLTGGAAAAEGAAAGAGAGAAVGALVSGGQGFATASSVFGMLASFERREQEWEFERDLAEQFDSALAQLQVDLAEAHVGIVEQEREIAALQAQQAGEVLSFLAGKFTNADLYAWMADVVGGAYRYFLQQAASIARIAERQLGFERQEPQASVILGDYWTPASAHGMSGGGPDRRGMTGSVRLLEDITRLDQQAFLSDQRKLQLTKTISLAALDPIAFERFRETGVLPFVTTMEMFDRDFPGHYLRLVKRVRTSVVALVPPADGIKATLSTSGISSVTRGGDDFVDVRAVRPPDRVALSSPLNATGVFELQEQPEMLLPFEGSGVATAWELTMPRAANRFNYDSIFDVLISIDYTALDSPEHRRAVIDRMNPELSLERPFRFRREFTDQWYDLHNPDLTVTPMRVIFDTGAGDFAANLTDLRIEHVSLYLASEGERVAIPIDGLRFTPADGTGGAIGGPTAGVADGLYSTRRGNVASWYPFLGRAPVGRWELQLPNTSAVRSAFRPRSDGGFRVTDIIFSIAYRGMTTPWPS